MKLGAQQCTVLWHLMEEGSASVPQVATLSGVHVDNLYRVVDRLIDLGLVEKAHSLRQEQRRTRGYPARLYALTQGGIEMALAVDRIDVHFADERADQTAEAT